MTQESPADMPQLAAELENLQIKVAYQEASLAALNDALIAQQGRIDQLERLTQALLERLRRDESGATLPASPQDEIPPHY